MVNVSLWIANWGILQGQEQPQKGEEASPRTIQTHAVEHRTMAGHNTMTTGSKNRTSKPHNKLNHLIQQLKQCCRKWFGYLVRPARMSTQTMTSHRKLSGSFKRPGAVYSGWLFGDSESSSTSWNRLRSFGVPGTAAPVSVDVLRSLP